MQKKIVSFALLLFFVSIIVGNRSNCKRYENKVYRLTHVFPGKQPFYSFLRFSPNGMFEEFYNIANGNNGLELGANYSVSSLIGYYSCPTSKKMYSTGLGFLYKNEGIPFLKKNGGTGTVDSYFRFSDDRKKLRGKRLDAVYETGTDVFDEANQPVFRSNISIITGQRVKFRRRYAFGDSESDESDQA